MAKMKVTGGPPANPKWSPTNASQSQMSTDLQWWTLSGPAAANSVTRVLETMRTNQSARYRQLLLSSMLYCGRPVFNIYGSSSQMRLVRSAQVPLGRITKNLIQAAIDTLVAQLSSDENVPYYLTEGGSFKQQRQAKELTKFSDGILAENDAQVLGTAVLRDSLILGDGLVYGYIDDASGRVKFERVIAAECYVDELEGQYGEPRSFHRVRTVDKHVLMGQFKGAARELIKNAQQVTLDGAQASNVIQVADVVDVRESWHLPSGEDATDGRYTISIDSGVLYSEQWDEPWFPFVRLPWAPPVSGYWSMSAASQLQGIQMELNKLLWLQSRAIHLAAAFKCFIPADSRIVKEHQNNMIGTAQYFTGSSPPVYITVPAVSDQVIQRIGTLWSDGFEQLGVSALESQMKNDLGPNASGAAYREHADIQSQRFYAQGKLYQKFFIDLSRLGINLVKRAAEENGGHYEARAGKRGWGRAFLEKIDWKDLDIDQDQFTSKCWSVALLPETPEGQLQSIAEQVQAGWLTPQQGQRLMMYPDLGQAVQLNTAPEDYLHSILSKIVDGESEDPHDDYTPPSPEDNLELAAQLVGQYIAEAKTNGLDEDRINLLRDFAQQISALNDEAAQPPPGAGAPGGPPGAPPGPGGTPQAMAAPPPVSPLLPQGGAG